MKPWAIYIKARLASISFVIMEIYILKFVLHPQQEYYSWRMKNTRHQCRDYKKHP